MIRVDKLLDEIRDCEVGIDRLVIDGQAVVISDEDIEREVDLQARIGSTRQGVGAATARRIMERGGDVNRTDSGGGSGPPRVSWSRDS